MVKWDVLTIMFLLTPFFDDPFFKQNVAKQAFTSINHFDETEQIMQH
jgi:hypothetical protein